MPIKGADYAWWRPPPGWHAANGIKFVSRYLSWLPNGKVINRTEYQTLRAAGVEVCLNWEFDAQDQKRGYAGGTADASEAFRQAKALGVPEPFAIYFSADWDASASDFDRYVTPYLKGAANVLGGPQHVGLYSGYWTVKRALDHGLVKYGWQTFAWSHGLWDPRAQVRQTNIWTDYDLNWAQTEDYGQVGHPLPPVLGPTGSPVEAAKFLVASNKSGE